MKTLLHQLGLIFNGIDDFSSSASFIFRVEIDRPISNDEIKKLREKKETPEGKLDKNGIPLKFSRDSESDWTAIDDEPHYGLKEHASVDVNNGFILATIITPASYHESPYLPCCTIYSLHTDQPLQKVYADKGYFGKPNRDFLNLNGIEDGIMRKDTATAKLTEYEIERNKKLSQIHIDF